MRTAHHWRVGSACLLAFAVVPAASAQDGKVSRDGFDLHYRTAGTGTPVVILSGGPGSDVDYVVPLAEQLPSSYQRVFLEQRGTGRSKLPEMTSTNMTLRLAVEDLEALRLHLKQERLFLVGHSWGGMLAMAYAAAYPNRIDRMILIGPGGPTLEYMEWLGDNIAARMRPEDVAATEYWAEAAKRGVDEDKASLESIRATLPAFFFDRSQGLAAAAQLKDGAIHGRVSTLLMSDLVKHYDLRPGLRLLKAPVLIVQGHQDPIGDMTAAEIHNVIAGSSLRFIAKSGHFPWIEQPEKFRSIVAEFLKAP